MNTKEILYDTEELCSACGAAGAVDTPDGKLCSSCLKVREEEDAEDPDFLKVIGIVNEAYGDDLIIGTYELMRRGIDESCGDGLAKFIVTEIKDTWEEDLTFPGKVKAARTCVEIARKELDDVIKALTPES